MEFRDFDFPNQQTLKEQVLEKQYFSQETAVIQTVKQVSPAVVSIIVTKDLPVFEEYYLEPFKEFEEFFGNEDDEDVKSKRKKNKKEKSKKKSRDDDEDDEDEKLKRKKNGRKKKNIKKKIKCECCDEKVIPDEDGKCPVCEDEMDVP